LAQSTPKIVGRLCQTPVQLGRLQKQVDNAANAILTAESRRNQFAQRIKELIATAGTLWGRSNDEFSPGISPAYSLVEAYGNVVALENALADFSRIKPQLVANLDAAKEQLAEFSKRATK